MSQTRGPATVALFIGLILAPLLMGGVHLPSTILLLLIFGLGLTKRTWSRGVRMTHFSWILLGVSLVCLMQLIPIPVALLSLIAPSTATAVREGSAILGEPASWAPVSIDPYQTMDRGFRFVALALASLLALNVARRGSFVRLARVLIGLGIVVAIVGAILNVTDAKSLWVVTTDVGFRKPSTFVNTNHGATFFGFLTIVSLMWFERSRETFREAAVAGAASICFLLLTLLHESIGVFLALSLSAIVFALSHPAWRRRPSTYAGVFVAVAVIALGLWLDLHTALGIGFGDTNNRWLITKAGWRAIGDYWLLGSGAGTIDSVIPTYIDWSTINAYQIPTLENEILEFFVVFGAIGGLAILGAVLGLGWSRIRRSDAHEESQRARWHVVLGAYLFFIGCLHFPFFTLGLSVPIVIAIETTDITRYQKRASRPVLAAILIVVVLLGVLGTWRASTPLARPMSAETYIGFATTTLAGDPARAVEAAEFALRYDPRPRVVHYAARMNAKNKHEERAAELYQQLFRISGVTRLRLSTFVKDVRSIDARVSVLRYLDESDWFFVANSVVAYEGPVEGLELAYRSIDEGVHATSARTFVAETFLTLGQSELAMMWAQTSGASKSLAIRIALGEKQFDQALRLIAQDREQTPHQTVLRYAVQLLPLEEEVVIASRDEYCVSPIPKSRFRTCWRVDAVIAEYRGQLERAETILDRIHRRLADPRPLARFYARHRNCRELHQLAQSETHQGFRKQVKKLAQSCTEH